MQNLLYINKNQFGYHTDAFMHCAFAKEFFDIQFVCFDSGLEKIIEKHVKVVYVKDSKNKISNAIRFFLVCSFWMLKSNSIVFIQYFHGCDLFKKIFFWKKMILDIRSVSISNNELSNASANAKITKAANVFNHVTVITEGVRDYLSISAKKSTILPLGTNILSQQTKKFSQELNLLYVGTLDNRNIHLTIIGIKKFVSKFPETKIQYYIVGDGQNNMMTNLKNLIIQNKLEDTVFLLGRKRHHEIQHLWDNCQIGISFVPITKAYNLQPPTKTLEYFSAGMAVIATETNENSKMINAENGVLIQDNPESFCEGLTKISSSFSQFDSNLIRTSVLDKSWQSVVHHHFIKIKDL